MLHPIACCPAFLSVPGIGRKTLFDFRNQIAGIDSSHAAFSLLRNIQKSFPGGFVLCRMKVRFLKFFHQVS